MLRETNEDSSPGSGLSTFYSAFSEAVGGGAVSFLSTASALIYIGTNRVPSLNGGSPERIATVLIKRKQKMLKKKQS
jgi:hypothetical protein